MKSLRQKFIVVALFALVAVVGIFLPVKDVSRDTEAVLAGVTDPIKLIVPGADTFHDVGIYLQRPKNPAADHVYTGSVVVSDNFITNYNEMSGTTDFQPKYSIQIFERDSWVEYYGDDLTWSEFAPQTGVHWYLKETAQAAIYRIVCAYSADDYQYSPLYYTIAYTDDWNYVKVQNLRKETYVTDFFGGRTTPLNLWVTYNPGATITSILEDGPAEKVNLRVPETGLIYGCLSNEAIVTTNQLVGQYGACVSVKTLSGEIYDQEKIYAATVGNMVAIYFDEALKNDVYLLQLTSPYDNTVFGQLIIDNSGGVAPVNVSRTWVAVMLFGGLLAVGASAAYFIPLIIVRVNVVKVDRENKRVAQMKNPESYVDDGGNFFQRLGKKMQKFGKKKKKGAAAEETPKLENQPEEQEYKPTRMEQAIQRNREQRQINLENELTGGRAAEIKRQNEEMARMAQASFAALRDDDDGIASLHREKEEAPTIETGSYVEDGVTFSKLDSMKDHHDDQNH